MININKSWLVRTPFAHRGLHDGNRKIPENSLVSFEQAIQRNFSIELDVHLLSDGHIVVFHDNTLERMCLQNEFIQKQTIFSIKKFDLLNSKEKIPLFSEVLDLVNGKVPLLIEIKKQNKIGQIENALLKVLENYNGEYAIQSFDPFSLAWFAEKAPNILRGQLSGNFKNEKMNFLIKFALNRFIFNYKSKPNFIAYDCNDLPNNRVENFRRKGKPILSWTIKSPNEYEKVINYCDNIIFEGFIP